MGFVDKGVELPEDKCSLTVSKYWSLVDTTVALPLSAGRNLKSDLRNFRDLRAVSSPLLWGQVVTEHIPSGIKFRQYRGNLISYGGLHSFTKLFRDVLNTGGKIRSRVVGRCRNELQS